MKNLLTIKQAAQNLGITASALHEWLKNHPAIRDKYCRWDRFPGKKPQVFLESDALLVIANVKNNFYGNQSIKGVPGLIEKGKTRVAEHVLKAQQSTMSAEEALLKAVQLLVDHGQRIQSLEQKAEKPSLPAPAAPASQNGALRPLLCQRINSYAKDIGAEHRDLWNLLYRNFSEKYGIDLLEVADRAGQKPLDFAEQNGHILPLYQLAAQLYRSHRALTV